MKTVCKFGRRCCFINKCRFLHPEKDAKPLCKYGLSCSKSQCRYTHPQKKFIRKEPRERSEFSILLLTLPDEVIDNIFEFFNPYKLVLYRLVMMRINRMPKFTYQGWINYRNLAYFQYQFVNGRMFTITINFRGEYQNEAKRRNSFGFALRSAIVRSTPIVLMNFKHKFLNPVKTISSIVVENREKIIKL
jgi:hypothetical protein